MNDQEIRAAALGSATHLWASVVVKGDRDVLDIADVLETARSLESYIRTGK